MQLVVWGIPLVPADVRHLVATLVAAGLPDGLSAAAAISRALDSSGGLVALTPEQRDAVLVALEDPPDGLAELRGALADDYAYRHRQP